MPDLWPRDSTSGPLPASPLPKREARKSDNLYSMKSIRVRLAATFAAALLAAPFGSAQQAAAGRGTAVPRPVSPEIHSDHTVTFRLAAPKANEVTLNGSWEGARDLKMTKDENGVWSTTVGPLGAQLWGYWFLVDG